MGFSNLEKHFPATNIGSMRMILAVPARSFPKPPCLPEVEAWTASLS